MFDNEIDITISFLRDMESKQIQSQRSDEWVWMTDSSGQFSTKSAYNAMREASLDGIEDTAFAELWKLDLKTIALQARNAEYNPKASIICL